MEGDEGRKFLQAGDWLGWKGLDTAQRLGQPEPPWYNVVQDEAQMIQLPEPSAELGTVSVRDVLQQRRSRRRFSDQPLALEELAFLLWSVQGISGGDHRKRTAPSAGARHPLETYVACSGVNSLPPGIYRYQVERHALAALPAAAEASSLKDQLTSGCLGQAFVGAAPVCFLWTVRPERSQWRYGPLASKLIVLDTGHAAQNLYLAAESIGAGTCTIGLYDQDALDGLLGVDGIHELVVYAAPVGFPID